MWKGLLIMFGGAPIAILIAASLVGLMLHGEVNPLIDERQYRTMVALTCVLLFPMGMGLAWLAFKFGLDKDQRR